MIRPDVCSGSWSSTSIFASSSASSPRRSASNRFTSSPIATATISIGPTHRRRSASPPAESDLIQDALPQLAPLFAHGGSDFSGILSMAGQRYVTDARRIYYDLHQPDRYLVLATLWPRSHVAAEIAALRNRTLLVAGALLVFGVIAVALLAGGLVRPLRALTDATTRIAAGEHEYPRRRRRPQKRRGRRACPLDRCHGRRDQGARRRDPHQGRGSRAHQQGTQPVRLCRLARPAGTAAHGRQLPQPARAPLRRQARRRRPTNSSTSPSTAPAA